MTVQELIKILKKLPSNMEVCIYDESDHRYICDDPYVFPDDQMKEEMIEDGKVPPDERLVLSFCGRYDD